MSKKTNPNVAQLISKVEAILDWFESDKLELDKALTKYEEGLSYIDELESFLEQAKVKVEKINKKFE